MTAGGTPAVTLNIKGYCLPGILDSASSYSFIRRDVFQQIKSLGFPCSVKTANRTIHIAAGHSCVIKEAVSLQIKIHSFSWKYDFLLLGDSPAPCILGVDFLSFAKIQHNFATFSYAFVFARSCQYDFEPLDFSAWNSHCFPCPEEVLKQLVDYTSSMSLSDSSKLEQLVLSFPKLFSDQLGTVKGMICQLDLTDDLPVRSGPYQCSPPRLQALREIVQDLLNKGAVKKSYS
jgi:hypothetical protein